jgi:hypothetical protein
VTLSLYLIKHHAINMHGMVEVWHHMLLTPAPDGIQWSASRSNRFTPGKDSLVPTGKMAKWDRDSLDVVAKRKFPPCS